MGLLMLLRRTALCKCRSDDMLLLPVNACTSAGFHRMVLADINAQPARQRIILKGCLLDGRSPAEVARELHVPMLTVRLCLRYGRRDLERRARDYARMYGLRIRGMPAGPFYEALAEADMRACTRSATSAGKAAVLAAVQMAIGRPVTQEPPQQAIGRLMTQEPLRQEERVRPAACREAVTACSCMPGIRMAAGGGNATPCTARRDEIP